MILTHPSIDPIIFSLGFIQVRWYGLAYVAGFILGLYLIKLFNKKFNNRINNKEIDSFLIWAVIGVIIGGRVGYVFFYQVENLLLNPLYLFFIWQGGMSFHGGLIGIIISIYFFCKKNNIEFFYLADLVSITAPIGIFFGRLANFINSELYGTTSNVPWSVIFVKVDNLTRHPSQLYEAILEGIILFLILMHFKKKKFLSKPGTISGLFLIFYSIFRFFVEFYRVPDEQIGYLAFNLSIGQIISLVFLIIGTNIFYYKNENK